MTWELSSSSDRRALDIVDGTGPFDGNGPHYSRRTPGSKTFTGVGREIVLVTTCSRAVWAVVQQRLPAPRGSGASRGRGGATALRGTVWRNNMFRNLGAGLSSELIEEATRQTVLRWFERYGELPKAPLRTEVDVRFVKSSNPGYCYLMAGWTRGPIRRHKLHLFAPPLAAILSSVQRRAA